MCPVTGGASHAPLAALVVATLAGLCIATPVHRTSLNNRGDHSQRDRRWQSNKYATMVVLTSGRLLPRIGGLAKVLGSPQRFEPVRPPYPQNVTLLRNRKCGHKVRALSEKEESQVESHLAILREHVGSAARYVTVLEEDAELYEKVESSTSNSAATQLAHFLKRVPNDWDMIYLSGKLDQTPPRNSTGGHHLSLDDPYWVNTGMYNLEAYMIKTSSIPKLLGHLYREGECIGPHIDQAISTLVKRGAVRSYMPTLRFFGTGRHGYDVTQGERRWSGWLGWRQRDLIGCKPTMKAGPWNWCHVPSNPESSAQDH